MTCITTVLLMACLFTFDICDWYWQYRQGRGGGSLLELTSAMCIHSLTHM